MSTEENKTLIQRSYDEFFNKASKPGAGRSVSYRRLRWPHSWSAPPVQGLEALKYIASGYLRASLTDLHITVEDIVAERDKVMTRMSWSGTQREPFVGIPATGKQVTDGHVRVPHCRWEDCGMVGLFG